MTSHTAGNTKVSSSNDHSAGNTRGTFGQSQGFGSVSGSNSMSGSGASKPNHSGPGFWDVSSEIGGTGLGGSQLTSSGSSNAPPGSGGSPTAGVIARPTPPSQGYQPPHQQSQHDRNPPFGGGSVTGSLSASKAPQNQSPANYIQSQPQYSVSTSNISQLSQTYSGFNASTTSLPSVISVPQSNPAQQRQPSPSVFPLPPVGSHQQPSGSYFPQNSQQQSQQQQPVSQRNSQIPSRSSPHVQATNPGTSQSPHYSPLLQHRQNDGSPHHNINQHTTTAVIGSPHGSLTGTANPGSAGTRASGRGSLYSPPPAPSQNAPSIGASGHAGAGSDRGNAGNAAAREREREREHREREQREQREREQHEREQREREHHYDHHQPPLGGPGRQPQQLRFTHPSGLGRSGGMAIDTSNIQNLTSPIIVQNPGSGGPLSPNSFSPNGSGGMRDPITLSSNNPALHRALLTPITHPAPPPAPSAPPTASTPGTDYYWGPSSATSSRWDREEEGDYGTPAPGPAPSTMTSLRGMPGSARQVQRGGLIGFLRGQGVGDDARRIARSGPPSGGLSSGMDLGGFSGTTNADRSRDRDRDDDLGRGHSQASLERPPSVGDDPEFDTDPIPAEYRPMRKIGDEEKARGPGGGSHSQNQGPPPRPQYQQGYVPQNVTLHHGNPPNSPPSIHAPIGYGNAQYTSKSQQGPARIMGMQPSSASSSTSTLPTSSTTTQAATRESIMRGQWVGGTAAVAGPAPITHSAASSTTGGHQRKSSENAIQQQMQERAKQPGSIVSGVPPMREQPKRVFSTDTINSQEWSHVSPVSSSYHGGYQPPQHQLPPMPKSSTGMTNTTTGSFTRAEDMLSSSLSPDKLESTTNPSAVPSPELFQHHHPLHHRPAHQQQKSQPPAQGQPHHDRSVSVDEEKLVSILKGLYKVLPDSHIQSLHNFALYLSEDALAAEKAQRLLNGKATPSGNRGSWGPGAMPEDISDRESRLDALAKERMRRWSEWVKVEEAERKKHVMALDPRKGKDVAGKGKTAASSNAHTRSNIESGRLSGGSESSSGVFVRSDGTLQSGTGEVISPPASAVGPGKATTVAHLAEAKSPKGGMDSSSHKNPFDTETEAELDTEDEATDDDGDMRNIKRRLDNVEQPGSGMQPLPPPPRIVRIDDGSTTPPASLEPFLNKTNKDQDNDRKNTSSPPLQTLHHHHPPHTDVNYQYDHSARRRDRNNSTPPEAPEPPPETPSPTPTFVQVANAPKVDLELQMPRPVPGIPAIRLDPSARKRVEDDDTSTIADSDHHRPDSDAGHRGQPGATPFYPKFSKLKENHRPIDIKHLTSVIAAFMKSGSGPDSGPDIPQFLHMAYQALDTATHSPSLDTYLSDARRRLDTRTNQLTTKYSAEAAVRKQQQAVQVDTYCNRGATYEEVESIEKRFQQEEAQRKIEVEAQIYQVFENDYVEIAYKDVKGQLEVLGGRWYDEVKTWLLNTAAGAAESAARSQPSGTAMHYYLLLEAVDLLNKLHVSMEEHEHVLQGLVSDRNQRYLQVSISPLIMQGNTEDAAEAERRFWMDEQGRGLVARADSVKRASDHAAAVERIVSDFVKGLKCKFEEVVRETYEVIFKLPPSTLQTQLFRRFFDDIGTNKITLVHHPDGENLAAPLEIIGVIGDSVQALSDIVGLIKVSLDLQAQAQIRKCEAQCSLQVVQDYNRKNGITAPQITANAVTAGLALVLPGALKRLSEEQGRTVADVLEESMDVVRRLGALVAALKKDPGSSGSSVAGSSSRHGSQVGGGVKPERHQQHNNSHNQVSPRWNEVLESPLWPPSSANVGSGKDAAWAFMAPAQVQMPQMPPMHYHHQQPQQTPQQPQQPPMPPPHQTQPQLQQHPQVHHPQHAQSPGFSLIGSLRVVSYLHYSPLSDPCGVDIGIGKRSLYTIRAPWPADEPSWLFGASSGGGIFSSGANGTIAVTNSGITTGAPGTTAAGTAAGTTAGTTAGTATGTAAATTRGRLECNVWNWARGWGNGGREEVLG